MRDLPTRLFDRAGQYLRTAEHALDEGDVDAAFENARTAAELAAKAALHAATGSYGAKHNVAGALVQTGIWPKARGGALAKFLDEYIRGVYSFSKPVTATDAKKAIRLAQGVMDRCASRLC